MIKILAALDKFGGIGRDNKLPWKHSKDLKWFKETTLNNLVVMGRKTFESLDKKPLPNRSNFVVTQSITEPVYLNGVMFIPSLLDFLFQRKMNCNDHLDTYIIGGASVYKQALDFKVVDEMILSYIDVDGECDTFFPAIPSWFKPKKIEEINMFYKRVTYVFGI